MLTNAPWKEEHLRKEHDYCKLSAIFNFQSLISVILLLICTCAYIRSFAPKLVDRNKEGLLGVFWKLARIGERLSPWLPSSIMAPVRTGRIDENTFEIKKRQPQKPSGIRGGHNNFYVTKKTSISATMKRVEEILHNKGTEIYIHGLGASLNRAMVLALEIQKTFTNGVSLNITTSTVNVTDDLFPMSDEFEMGIRNRPLSAVQIHICRIQV
ncbi:unnamed protein product [Cylicocyclus nassatus]|uniref:Uncharacterized protein n=1 Tax=Cylicocyclus nassatus TaxID=53992 RepID=A0AA36GYW7_CYLNA|nr:unnamed protein product [Cylicocyclus nassatus]